MGCSRSISRSPQGLGLKSRGISEPSFWACSSESSRRRAPFPFWPCSWPSWRRRGTSFMAGSFSSSTPSGTRRSSLLRGRRSARPRGFLNPKACARPTASCRSSPAS
ncbi:MAG: hypothetical protein MZV64_52990 [Ignavibacteriales bacterium]|nr:hypothetical protein [Ignavibacteriales bacterium]